jgi:acyl-CoA synthetase (AMP-forming)/AMP-acid ligase II
VDRPSEWRLDSAGLPVGEVELRSVDLESGQVLQSGDIGEIQVRSASAMAGYLPDSETSAAFVDGWYRTGDVGWIEDGGWVHLTDRCKEMIKVNGFQVAPAEIESVLYGHPSVVDCAVFGVPDERAGEVPVAAVQLEPGAVIDAAELQRVVSDVLATYKQLRAVVQVDSVPRTPSGKVLRRALRDEWLSGTLSASPMVTR